MAIDLSRGILPGLQVADQLQTSRAVRESQAQADMIALSKFEAEQEAAELDAQIAAQALSEVGSIARGDGRTASVDMSGGEDDPAALLSRVGQLYMQAGATKRGKEFLEAGIDYIDKASQVSKRQQDEQKARLENISKAAGYMFNTLGTAGNDSEYQHIFNELPPDIAQILGEENVEALRNMEWTPDFQNYLRARALSVKQQADIALAEGRLRNAETATENARRIGEANTAINRARLEEQRRERERKEKEAGPNAATAPTTAQLNAVKDKMRTSVRALEGISWSDRGYPTDPEVANSFDAMAQDIASEAQRIVAENKGVMTFAEAVDQAILEAEAHGDFQIIEAIVRPWLPDTPQKPGKYQRKPRPGRSADNPAPLPKGSEAEVARQLKKGHYYSTPMGTLRWNGSSFDE